MMCVGKLPVGGSMLSRGMLSLREVTQPCLRRRVLGRSQGLKWDVALLLEAQFPCSVAGAALWPGVGGITF